MSEYSVHVVNDFEADTPEQAAQYMLEWLQDTMPWVSFRVISETGQTTHIDTMDLNL